MGRFHWLLAAVASTGFAGSAAANVPATVQQLHQALAAAGQQPTAIQRSDDGSWFHWTLGSSGIITEVVGCDPQGQCKGMSYAARVAEVRARHLLAMALDANAFPSARFVPVARVENGKDPVQSLLQQGWPAAPANIKPMVDAASAFQRQAALAATKVAHLGKCQASGAEQIVFDGKTAAEGQAARITLASVGALDAVIEVVYLMSREGSIDAGSLDLRMSDTRFTGGSLSARLLADGVAIDELKVRASRPGLLEATSGQVGARALMAVLARIINAKTLEVATYDDRQRPLSTRRFDPVELRSGLQYLSLHKWGCTGR